MAAREQTEKPKPLEALRKLSSPLAELLEDQDHPPQTIVLAYNVLKETQKIAVDAFFLDRTLCDGLKDKTFNKENLPQILRTLHQTVRAGHNPSTLAVTLRVGMEENIFNRQNLADLLELASRHAKKGKDPEALTIALQSPHLPPTPENLAALKEAEPHIIKAYDFLHGVEYIEDHKSVTAPLFAHVLKTYKTELPKMGEKKYWQWIGLHAKELKANRTSVKP